MATTSVTINFTSTWTVPAGVTSVVVDAYGGAGLLTTNSTSYAHPGGRATGTLATTPGESLGIYIQGGGAGSGAGGAGGNAADVRQGGTLATNRKVVAAGGGGDGNGTGGGSGGAGGGLTGTAGTAPSSSSGGGGGTQTYGGPAYGGATSGYEGVGGRGSGGGGGGGAGYYGGGGGGYGGGGGGSSYIGGVTSASTTAGVNLGAPYVTITYETNSPPNAPAPNAPANNASVDRTSPIRLAATFSDPNTGDYPSESHWRYRLVGAPTWTSVTQSNTLQTYDIPAGLAAGNYEWQGAYRDSQGAPTDPAALVYSSSSFFTAATPPPGPTLVAPAVGETIGTSSYTGTISAPDLQVSEWTLYADNAGAVGAVLQGPVTVNTGDLRSHTFTGLANNTPVWWSVRTQNAGLWSASVQRRTPVSYTAPASPLVTKTEDPTNGALIVTITNPAPSGGQPAGSFNDVQADDLDGAGFDYRTNSRMLAPNTPWTYWLPRSTVDTLIKVTTTATNGTTSSTVV